MNSSEKKYVLTILVPSDTNPDAFREICCLESDEMFPTINKGDFIDPRVWEGKGFEKYTDWFDYGDVLKVDSVYHYLGQEKDGSYGQHIIDIFTKVVKKNKSNK